MLTHSVPSFYMQHTTLQDFTDSSRRLKMEDAAHTRTCQYLVTHLEMDIWDFLPERDTCRPVDDLHSDWSITFGLQDVIHKILWCKVHIAASVWIVLT